jgi:protein TonB
VKPTTILRWTAIAGIGAWIASASFAPQGNRTLARAFPAKLLASPANCTTPAWPKEAQRYEVEGISVLHFQIGADGVVEDAKVVSGSSWGVLDEAALQAIRQCRFKAGLDSAERDKIFPVQFVWTLSGPPSVRPHLVPHSCAPSAHFSTFQAYDRHPTGPDGVLLRFLVNPQGEPYAIKTEAYGNDAPAGEAAATYVKSCRFVIDPSIPGEKTDTVYGRVLAVRK